MNDSPIFIFICVTTRFIWLNIFKLIISDNVSWAKYFLYIQLLSRQILNCTNIKKSSAHPNFFVFGCHAHMVKKNHTYNTIDAKWLCNIAIGCNNNHARYELSQNITHFFGVLHAAQHTRLYTFTSATNCIMYIYKNNDRAPHSEPEYTRMDYAIVIYVCMW